MATLFVRHEVADFGKWKDAYDAFDDERSAMGVTGDGVYRGDENPDMVTVYHHFTSMDAARAFVANPRLKQVMETAGVSGTPELWLCNKV